MSTETTSTEALTEVLQRLDEEEAYHAEKLQQVRGNRQAVLHVHSLVLGQQTEQAEPTAGGRHHARIVPQDLARCETIKAAYREIARLSAGFVRCNEAAQLIMAAKLSSSASSHIFARDLHRWLAGDRDFEHSGPGVYRYLPLAVEVGGGVLPEEQPRPAPAPANTRLALQRRIHGLPTQPCIGKRARPTGVGNGACFS